MLTIRMRRLGAKKRPFFRVVVTESRTPRDGRSLEVIGHYNPATEPEQLTLNRERLQHWLDKGAQPSDTVRTLLGRHPEDTSAVDTPSTGADAVAPATVTAEPTDAGTAGAEQSAT